MKTLPVAVCNSFTQVRAAISAPTYGLHTNAGYHAAPTDRNCADCSWDTSGAGLPV